MYETVAKSFYLLEKKVYLKQATNHFDIWKIFSGERERGKKQTSDETKNRKIQDIHDSGDKGKERRKSKTWKRECASLLLKDKGKGLQYSKRKRPNDPKDN